MVRITLCSEIINVLNKMDLIPNYSWMSEHRKMDERLELKLKISS